MEQVLGFMDNDTGLSFPAPSELMTPVDKLYVISSNLVSFLNLAGAIVIVSTYSSLKEIRNTSRLLLVHLSIANFFLVLSTFLQSTTYYKNIYFPLEKNTLCQFSAFWMVESEITVALWTMVISFYLFLCVTCNCITIANRLQFMFHIFCWIMPFIVAMAADLSGVYGYDTSSMLRFKHSSPCWISSRVGNPLPWYLITVEGWVLAAFVVICLLYLPTTWSIMCRKNRGKEIIGDDVIEDLAVRTANEQLRFIPAIYVATRIWGTIYFFFTRYPEPRHLRASDWLLIIKGIGDNSQSFFNALFFCFATKQVRHHMAKKLASCCSCFRTCLGQQKWIGSERWMRVPNIVRPRTIKRGSRNLDGSDLDISGISLDLPSPDADLGMGDEETIFERHRDV